MKKSNLTTILIMIMVLLSIVDLYSQNVPAVKVDFKNAPVLFKEDGKSYQQVIASYKAEDPDKIIFSLDGKELLKADLKKGNNRFLLLLRNIL